MRGKRLFLFNARDYEKVEMGSRGRKYRFEVLRASFKVAGPVPSVFATPSLLDSRLIVIDRILLTI